MDKKFLMKKVINYINFDNNDNNKIKLHDDNIIDEIDDKINKYLLLGINKETIDHLVEYRLILDTWDGLIWYLENIQLEAKKQEEEIYVNIYEIDEYENLNLIIGNLNINKVDL